MDASAIMQNDSRVDNVRAMTEFTRSTACTRTGTALQRTVHEDHVRRNSRQPIAPTAPRRSAAGQRGAVGHEARRVG